MRQIHVLLAISIVICLAGCGGPRSVALPVRGVAPLNPNDAKESVPVNVRIYPLSSDGKYRSASVDQLWTNAKTLLGSELEADPVTITVFPGAAADPAVVHRLELPASTRYIGVLAMYQGADAVDRRITVSSVEDAERWGLTFTGYGVVLASPQAAASTDKP